jgi:predicted nuclease with TOPRIM domain
LKEQEKIAAEAEKLKKDAEKDAAKMQKFQDKLGKLDGDQKKIDDDRKSLEEEQKKLDKKSGLEIIRSLKFPSGNLPKGFVLCNQIQLEKRIENGKMKLVPIKILVENIKMPSMESVYEINIQSKNTLIELEIIKKY